MPAHLKRLTKTQLEKLLTEPPFPSYSAAAKQLGLHPQSVYTQRDADPEWYAAVKALREQRQMEWISQQQARAVAELHDMTEDALKVKREHIQPHFTMRMPMVAEKASDYVLDHVIGKAKDRIEVSGKDGQPIQHEGHFDTSAFTTAELRDFIARATGGGKGRPEAENAE